MDRAPDRAPGMSVRLKLTLSYTGFLMLAGTLVLGVVWAFLLAFGLVGGWLLAGRMLTPLTRITDATRLAATGSLARVRYTHVAVSSSAPASMRKPA